MSDLSCPPGKYSTCYEAALAEYISINKHNWTEAHMLPRKGQVVIWDSNLIHGGGFVRNEAITRMSQVTHYFFDDDEFFFQPKLSESDGTQFYKVSMRADVPVGLSARDIIDLHWQSHGLRYKVTRDVLLIQFAQRSTSRPSDPVTAWNELDVVT